MSEPVVSNVDLRAGSPVMVVRRRVGVVAACPSGTLEHGTARAITSRC
jgi:hypothetical protein